MTAVLPERSSQDGRHPASSPHLDRALSALVALAPRLIPGCDRVGVELLGYGLEWGQPLDAPPAAGTDDIFRLPLLSGPVNEAGELLGLLNLYACGRRFGPEATEPARLLASLATALIAMCDAARRREDQLREALASGDVIGQAQGVLMAQRGVDADAAFRMLVRASRRQHRELREVAAEVAGRAARPDECQARSDRLDRFS